MPRRVALYPRVSTTEQHIEPQLYALHAYAEARGLDVTEEYVDHGVSGTKHRRPALDKLLADARRRVFHVLACPKLDRLARSVCHLTSLGRELLAAGRGSGTLRSSTWADRVPRQATSFIECVSAFSPTPEELLERLRATGVIRAYRAAA